MSKINLFMMSKIHGAVATVFRTWTLSWPVVGGHALALLAYRPPLLHEVVVVREGLGMVAP